MYFDIERAEQIKATYGSWVSKKAYAGEGKMEVLKRIRIVARKKTKFLSQNPRVYKIEFQFENGQKLSSQKFFRYNGIGNVPVENTRQTSLFINSLFSAPALKDRYGT